MEEGYYCLREQRGKNLNLNSKAILAIVVGLARKIYLVPVPTKQGLVDEAKSHDVLRYAIGVINTT